MPLERDEPQRLTPREAIDDADNPDNPECLEEIDHHLEQSSAEIAHSLEEEPFEEVLDSKAGHISNLASGDRDLLDFFFWFVKEWQFNLIVTD